ncbi:hypothetical protein J4E85_011265 [Alternaria conjuncta]|uniref:uncharacterized protein n=1 Tax=Alternaria conjuncta TaxID=181017 RepID=UPI002220DA17|nr:uncharacterized protein J4E85_011265 [Alternaria conjuncta]KAI4911356.1 hypothetical protein J4E85_011265 [Alternaria conjuncta]
MYLPKEHPDRQERLDLEKKITSQWETTTKSTACIPSSMRYPKDLEWWPIEILRALGELADEMPGIDNWNSVYDLLVEGNKERLEDSLNTLSAEIQLSDISYVREQRYNKGKQKMIDTTTDDDEADIAELTSDDDDVVDLADDTDDVDDTIKSGETSGIAATLDTTVATINQQDDDPDALPADILPTDSQDVKIKKWNLWINHYWQERDCRVLIPEEMLQRHNNKKTIRSRELKSYGKKRNGEVNELLYELAKITRMQRKDAAWAKIKENWTNRKAGTNGHKALSAGDVKSALDYFRNLPQGEGEESAASGGLASAVTSSDSELED